MTVRNLDALFQPKSVAVIGASPRSRRIGAMVWARVLAGGFDGPAWPVNPKYAELDGRAVFADVGDLLEAPSVALVCTPSATWPDIIAKLGKLGTRSAILVGDARGDGAARALAQALAAARPYLLRILGPGSLGVVTPALKAQFGAPSCMVKEGGVAWVSQSNALTNAVLGWAHARGLGFSHAIALGDEADVDAGDVLDYLASDGRTRAILLELSAVRAARKFMSAARAAARNKPVLVLRTGHHDPADALYAAAFRRAGMVRVDALDDLLDEIETLGVGRIAASSTATLITSDRGVGTLAADAFSAAGHGLAQWSDEAARALRVALPHVAPGNPLLLGGDATPEQFGRALEALAPHRETGTAFVVHAPTHSAPVAEVARMLIERQRFAYRGLLACFFGGVDDSTRDALRAHGIAVHSTPHRLARAFARLVDYRLGRELLMQTPPGLPEQVPASIEAAQAQARAALAAGQVELAGEAAAALLVHFGLDVLVSGAGEKAVSDMATATALDEDGHADADADETIVDVKIELRDDAQFGPVFRFTAPSHDGIAAPFATYGFPPLNPVLAREIVAHSPYARRAAVEPTLHALTALSEAVCDIEEIVALDAVLRVTRTRAWLVAPRVRLAQARGRLAIVPYPRCLEQTIDWHGEPLTIRPIRPEDEAAHSAFIAAMTADDLRMRFFAAVSGFDHSQLARMTQIDYDREMALIATTGEASGAMRTLGVARIVTDPDNERAEFAMVVRSDLKGKGLGKLLMQRMLGYTRARGTRSLVGFVLRENAPMLGLAKACGFAIRPSDDPAVVQVELALDVDGRERAPA
ncbi:GNAT family N-acetyltransferase [Trinickia fusca]|uniref:GNAT family N-acetyltransferase n=1 Tax=Trinickia fusca TaxID=2419777 RepID=A0A494XC87_9BURK|nr:GNAT family N-acetyltransferase [Trinickia fusca]RKP48477.1 GNAT family N-acetyltransferase [Trinickia fusca]